MTIQRIFFIAALVVLFTIISQRTTQDFIPYVAIGFIGFSWMTDMISGGANCVVGNGAIIKTSTVPKSIYSLKVFAGATIQLAHDALAIVLVVVLCQIPLGLSLLLFPVALILIAINGVAIGLWLGPLCARYRDVGQIVGLLVRVLFFFTPIFWVASDLSSGQRAVLSGWNPVAYLLELFRAPLLGNWPTTLIIAGSFAITIANTLFGIYYFSRTRDRWAYWL
jgi:ABC-type polysaccharide/polyol phosphate export permease